VELNLKDKVAIITGGGQGLGKAIALELATEGVDIVIADINLETSMLTVKEIELLGKRAIAVKADVRIKADTEYMVKMAVETFNRLDILVNNAGLTLIAPLLQITEENWNLLVDTNLKGTFLCSQAAARVMVPQREGCIINISSMCGIQGWAERGPYGATKAGIINLTRILAAELGPVGIRVNCIAPGYTLTNSFYQLLSDGKIDDKELLKGIPMGKFVSPEEIAYAVGFLVSKKASCITGEVLVIDGGWTSSGGAWQVFPSKMKFQK